MTKEELKKMTSKNWAQIFGDFILGLLKETDKMNEEMCSLVSSIEEEKDCSVNIAKTNQLDKDIKRILDFIERFCEEKSLNNIE